MAIDIELAKRLRSYRNFKHLTQKDVAMHLNVPHSAISDIENGKRDITVSELKVFSNLYGRSVEEIISGKKYDYYNIANIARLLTELTDGLSECGSYAIVEINHKIEVTFYDSRTLKKIPQSVIDKDQDILNEFKLFAK